MRGPAAATSARRLWARPGGGAILGSCVLAVVLVGLNGIDLADLPGTMQSIATLLAVLIGALLVLRVPANTVGWLLWLGGLLNAVALGTGGLAAFGLVGRPGSVPGALAFAWVSAWIGILPLFLLAGFLPLVFPTGRTHSPVFRAVAIVGIGALALQVVAAMFGPGTPGSTYPTGTANPLLLAGVAGTLVIAAGAIGQALGGLVLAASMLSIAIRFRRSSGVERQQLKWFTSAALLALAALIAAASVTSGSPSGAVLAQVLWLATFTGVALLPVAIGIAILRYRLYEIDRLVSRTITYALVTAILVASFVVAVLLLQAALAPFTGESTIAVAGSTLVVAALFQPVRSRVQRSVNRRFNRARYDAERTVAAFAGSLRDEVELEKVSAELLRTVAQTVEPASVGLWLRE